MVPVVNGVPWWYFHGLPGRFAGRRVAAVDPDGALLAALDPARLIGCVVFITAQCPAPGVAESGNPHLMIVGEPDNRLTPRLERLRSVIADAGIEARASNASATRCGPRSSPTSPPTRCPWSAARLEQLYSQPGLRELARATLNGRCWWPPATARVDIDPQTFLLGAGMGAVRTSMLQDHDKGRPLELAAIGDAVLELAELLDLPMPITRHLIALARFRSASH